MVAIVIGSRHAPGTDELIRRVRWCAKEFLLPPKPAFASSTGPSVGGGGVLSPHHDAPSFIDEAVTSPGDKYYFASPYPSGVTTVPVFRESHERVREEDEAAAVKPVVSAGT